MSLSAMVCLERCMKSLVLYFCDHQLYVCSLSLQTATKNFQLLAKFQVPFGQVHQNIEVLIAWVDSIILLYLEVGASEDERKEKKKTKVASVICDEVNDSLVEYSHRETEVNLSALPWRATETQTNTDVMPPRPFTE
jgi:hypothetical protein